MIVEHLSTAITLVSLIQCQKCYDFLKNTFQMKFCWCPNLSFFDLGPWAIIHGTTKLANAFISQLSSLMTSFERSLSKHSENHKIVDIGSTVLKLWQLKESPNHRLNQVVLFRDYGVILTNSFHKFVPDNIPFSWVNKVQI